MIGKLASGMAALAFPVVMGTGWIFSAAPASAQETSSNRTCAHDAWSCFSKTGPDRCWVASAPKESVNTRDGRVVSVNRGATLMIVSFIPSEGVNGQITFTGGYSFEPDSQVKVTIGDEDFMLFTHQPTNPELSWSQSTDDAKIVSAMKRGAEAVISARSSRGTDTKDTFSLVGFTAAYDDAKKACAG